VIIEIEWSVGDASASLLLKDESSGTVRFIREWVFAGSDTHFSTNSSIVTVLKEIDANLDAHCQYRVLSMAPELSAFTRRSA